MCQRETSFAELEKEDGKVPLGLKFCKLENPAGQYYQVTTVDKEGVYAYPVSEEGVVTGEKELFPWETCIQVFEEEVHFRQSV